MKIFFTCLFLSIISYKSFCQKPSEAFKDKVFLLKRFMAKNHYSPLAWNDSNSVKLFDKWIAELDEDKVVFTAKDIFDLEKYKKRASDINSDDFFTASVKLYRLRMHQADSINKLLLSKPLDFTKPDLIRRPVTSLVADVKELHLRRKQYLKYQILDDITDELETEGKNLTGISNAEFAKAEAEERERLKKRNANYFSVLLMNPADYIEEMHDRFLSTITACYDPHSNYMNFRERQEFQALVSAKEFTAGISLVENEKGDRLIEFIEPGSSAWKSGRLHKGDILVKIKTGNREYDISDLSSNALEQLLIKSVDFTLTVKTIAGEIKSVKLIQETTEDEESIVRSYVLTGKKKIGYIELPGFYSNETDNLNLNYNGCANDVSKEIIKLKKDNISGLVLDLRDNGGGSMWEAIQLAGIFIEAGPVASVKDKTGALTILKDPNRGTIYDGPMIILINGRSASASEFFAAAMQDYNRAVIAGGTTYGKGTAQEVLPLDTMKKSSVKDYKDFVKVTESKFYRITGSTVQWKGVEPDIPLPDIYSISSHREKNNLSALRPDNVRQAFYTPLEPLPIESLRQKSAIRVNNDAFYKGLSQVLIKASAAEMGMEVPLDLKGFEAFHKKLYSGMLQDDKKDGEKFIYALKSNNNSYDREKLSFASEGYKEANGSYLQALSQDSDINEACKILEDLIK